MLRLLGTAMALHALGDRSGEQQAIDALRARFSETEPYVLAEAYAWRGDRDRAIEWLDRAVAQRGGRGVSRLRIRWIKHDPLLAPIRDDPRYRAVLRSIRLPPT